MNILEVLKLKINTLYVKYLNDEEIEILPIHYIGGSQTLPPPLEAKEEEEYLKRLAENDLEARQILVERNLRLVVEDFANTLPDIQKILDKHQVTIKKIKNDKKDEEKSKDVHLVFRYHKDLNINSVLTEISQLENVVDLEEQ